LDWKLPNWWAGNLKLGARNRKPGRNYFIRESKEELIYLGTGRLGKVTKGFG